MHGVRTTLESMVWVRWKAITHQDGPLIGAAAKGVVLEYAGPKVVPVRGVSTPVHVINVRWSNGRTATVHLDAKTYLKCFAPSDGR